MKMIDKLFSYVANLYLWQFALVISAVLLLLGFTGEIPYLGIDLIDDKGCFAIAAGSVFFVASIWLKSMEVKHIEYKRNKNLD